MGIVISQYKDPYEPISTMECYKGFVAAAHLNPIGAVVSWNKYQLVVSWYHCYSVSYDTKLKSCRDYADSMFF